MESASLLCDLITDNLLPYLEPSPARLSKENEKDVLLSLTRVRRQIQRWTTNSSNKPDEMGGSSYNNHYCRQSQHKLVMEEHDCLCNVISAMVAFLNADSQFVRHVAGNNIVSVSLFLIKFECLWGKYIQWIWLSLEVFVSTIFSGPGLISPVINANDNLMLQELNIGDVTHDHNLQFARFITLLKSRLLNMNLFVVVYVFQALRNILKSLKHDFDDLEEVFLQCAVSSLMRIPWDAMIDIFGNSWNTSLRTFVLVDQLDYRRSLTELKSLLLGTILQLCCSLVKVYETEADGTCGGVSNELSVYLKFCDLLPKLLSCCFLNCLGNSRGFLYDYLGHKLLIMMTRLSLHSSWKIFHPESWLKFLRHFFGEIIDQSILGCDTGSENCLGESPFLASTWEGDKFYAGHIQRQAIFLLFKCSFTIASLEASKECACVEETTSSSRGFQICWKHSHSGSFEAFTWLQRWCFLDKFQGCNCLESCNIFALSFLQLYMEEDDLLFKMLLQLLDAPFSAWQRGSSTEIGFVGANKDFLCHFRSIFCPIRLFHLVLLLLHYDHLVLVDYLISKDTGILCLQYLLSCLHVIHESWPAFLQFTLFVNKSNNYHKKRRKIPQDQDESPTLLSTISAAFRRQLMRRYSCQTAFEINDLHTFEKAKECLNSFEKAKECLNSFEKAKECLNSLKRSLEELQLKSLFPYNPKPLLKSLTRFQELCLKSNFLGDDGTS